MTLPSHHRQPNPLNRPRPHRRLGHADHFARRLLDAYVGAGYTGDDGQSCEDDNYKPHLKYPTSLKLKPYEQCSGHSPSVDRLHNKSILPSFTGTSSK